MASVKIIRNEALLNFKSCGNRTDLFNLVCQFGNEKIPLPKPQGCSWRVGGLKNTIYKDNPEELEEWKQFYLPEYVNMVVLGTVEDIPCQGTQLVIVQGEDGHIYGHDGEILHLVAQNISELCSAGIQYPGFETFYRGESFKNMTKKDWADMRKSRVGRQLDQDHKDLVSSAKAGMRQRLAEIKRRRQGGISKLEKEPSACPVR